MRRVTMACAMLASLWPGASVAQEKQPLLDPATKQMTARGLSIALVGAAQVVEMRCDAKGQITAAIAKARHFGIVVDPSEKQDFADILYFASKTLEKAEAVGISSWCNSVAPEVVKAIHDAP